jgi:hypothetical protein
LQQLDHPAQRRGMEVFIFCQVTVEEELRCVDNREPAVAFAADRIVVEALGLIVS